MSVVVVAVLDEGLHVTSKPNEDRKVLLNLWYADRVA